MTAPMPEVTTVATEYIVTVLPVDHVDAHTWCLTVAYRGNGKWAVLRHSNYALSRQGSWDYERVPSERADEWLADHRFDLEVALFMAEQRAPHVVVNGVSAMQVLAQSAVEGGGFTP